MRVRSRRIFAGLLASAFVLVTAVALAQEHATPAGHGDHGAHGAQTQSVEHAGHADHHGPESINWVDVFDKKKPAVLALVINFGLLAALYYVLGKKPVAEGLKQRRITIGKEIEDAQKFLAEAKGRAKKYQGDLANADEHAKTARDSLIAAGMGDADRILKESNESAERVMRDADRLVEQERLHLQHEIHLEAIHHAVDEASKILAKSITPDDHARFANDLLAELSRRPAASNSTGGAS